MLDDDELLKLLKDLESDPVEREASASDTEKISRTICAFANDLADHGKTGVVFVGVYADGSCAGLSIDDDLLLKLTNLRTSGKLLPIPSMTVQHRVVDKCELAVIEVAPSSAPPVHEVMQRLEDLLAVNIRTALDLTSGPRDVRASDYPRAALQQLIRNALIHRTYEYSNAPVRIDWYNDRIEIHSPGGLFGQVTAESLGRGATDYRNPLVAESMKLLGYVQQFGYGIPTARKSLEQNGNPPPEFSLEQHHVLVTVKAAK